MDNRYFTVQELQTLKFYELPNTIYSHILSDLVHLFGGHDRTNAKCIQ